MNDSAPLMRKNKEDVENAERDCRDYEEIDRGKLFAVVFQKCAPCLRGRFWIPEHVLGDGCLRNMDSQLEQFAMNSRGSPEAIISAHRADKLTDILGNPGPSRLAAPAFPGPKQSESCAMPGDDCFRFNNDDCRAPLRPKSKEPNPEKSVPRPKSWAIGGTL